MFSVIIVFQDIDIDEAVNNFEFDNFEELYKYNKFLLFHKNFCVMLYNIYCLKLLFLYSIFHHYNPVNIFKLFQKKIVSNKSL